MLPELASNTDRYLMNKMSTIGVIAGCTVLASSGYFGYMKYIHIPASEPWLPVTTEKGFLSTPVVDPTPVIEEGETQELENSPLTLTRMGEYSHHYSKRQAWNKDESYFLTSDSQVISVDSQATLSVGSLSSETVWSNTDSELLFGIQEYEGQKNRFVSFNISTRKITEIELFSRFEKMTIGQWEGTISNDDSLIVFVGEQDGVKTLISYNILEKTILGEITAADNFNWSGISQLGNWILVENNQYPDPDPQLLRYKSDFTEETLLLSKPNHGDFCIDAYGNEVYAMTGRDFYWVDLTTKLISKHALPGTLYGHTSCRATDRPGWAYVSFEEDGGKIGAVPLIPDFDLWEPWSYHYSTSDTYATQPRASVSRSGKSIAFESDWNGEIPASNFVLRLNDLPSEPLKW